jgi:hypothetical protein
MTLEHLGLNSTPRDLPFDTSHDILRVTFSFCTWWPRITTGSNSTPRDLPFDKFGQLFDFALNDPGIFFFVLFIAAWAIFQLSGGCHHCRWLGCKFRPMLGAQGLWAGRDLYRATPTATRDLGLHGLIRKTGTHVPQWGSNPPTEGSSDLWARRSIHCDTRALN